MTTQETPSETQTTTSPSTVVLVLCTTILVCTLTIGLMVSARVVANLRTSEKVDLLLEHHGIEWEE